MHLFILCFNVFIFFSCKQDLDKKATNYKYYDKLLSDTSLIDVLVAITDEDYLQYGVSVAYVNKQNDTIIPFGKYAYFGSDSLKYFANVISCVNDSIYGRVMAIDRNQEILYDIVTYDNGPDYFNDGLTRVLRNGKMGYANKYGQVIIPCVYDYGTWFENGKAKVTYSLKENFAIDEHKQVESDEWFLIDKNGNKVE